MLERRVEMLSVQTLSRCLLGWLMPRCRRCPEGLRALAEKAPAVRVLTAALDDCLNETKFIVPGLGDYGDRYYGTFGYKEGLWGTDGK